ncbi:MAG: hypothetical protein JSU79_05440 [Dehalococcoidales bacterium]|nr:MAG: hypothetical protein JSU79_05440 [Dehalococcoidales bacterium]
MIILFEGEVPPPYRKLFTCLPFYILQPDRRVIDERSEIVEKDIEFRQLDFIGIRHVAFL